ncbi:hypothetical protein [Bacillus rhizoplanae]|uniref:hypothetical protein n=1 Tax=Bacillus rhizoplanae TaxID=2880966 RepID=UPI003D21BD2F
MDHNHCDDKSSNSNCACECVEGLAEQLKENKGELVRVFERNGAMVRGIIKDVENNVLILKGNPGFNPAKQTCTCEGQTRTEEFSTIFISICEITEFALELPL